MSINNSKTYFSIFLFQANSLTSDLSKLKHLILPELLHSYHIVGISYGESIGNNSRLFSQLLNSVLIDHLNISQIF
jgi:hypothetical protein